jgi:hypothetical protein
MDVDARAALSDADKGYRDLLEQLETQASASFDNMVLALSGGALGLSLTFLKDIAPQPVPWTVFRLLAPSWFSLVVSLLALMLSQLASMNSMRHEIECLDGRKKRTTARSGGIWRWSTSSLNYTACFGCVAGIALLVSFVVVNTEKKAMATDKQQQPAGQQPAQSEPRPLRESAEPIVERGRVTPDRPVATPKEK